MKTLLFFFFSLLSCVAYSQIEVSEGTKSMVEGNYNAYTTFLENVSKKDAENSWKDFMKEYKANTKYDKKKKIHFSDNVQIPSISSNPVDIYTSISEDSRSSTVSIWFDTGSGYVNSIDMSVQSEVAIKIVKEYATSVMRKHFEEIQKNEEKKYSDLNNDAKKLDNKNKELIEDIAKAKSNILKWEKELEQNEDDIDKKADEIEAQGKVLSKAKETTRKY